MSTLQEELQKLGGTLREYRAETTPIISIELAEEMGISINELARIELDGPRDIDELIAWTKAMSAALEKRYGPPPWWTKIPGVSRLVNWFYGFISGE